LFLASQSVPHIASAKPPETNHRFERGIPSISSQMSDDTVTKEVDLQNQTKTELKQLVNAYTKNHGPPDESHYDGAKNVLFGWTEDGNGVWILPKTKVNFERFEEIARSRPDLGHDIQSHIEIMRLAGAEFFADWRNSDKARAVKETESRVVKEDNHA
jgi:hypothetical protein